MIRVKYLDNTIKEFSKLDDIFDNNSNKIIKLDCRRCNLKEIPKKISQLVNLILFRCDNNNITKLPKELFTLTTLKFLSFGYNFSSQCL